MSMSANIHDIHHVWVNITTLQAYITLYHGEGEAGCVNLHFQDIGDLERFQVMLDEAIEEAKREVAK